MNKTNYIIELTPQQHEELLHQLDLAADLVIGRIRENDAYKQLDTRPEFWAERRDPAQLESWENELLRIQQVIDDEELADAFDDLMEEVSNLREARLLRQWFKASAANQMK
jgi:hypothetical protein